MPAVIQRYPGMNAISSLNFPGERLILTFPELSARSRLRRSRNPKGRMRRRLLYSVPVTVVLLVGVYLAYQFYVPVTPAMDFTLKMTIEVPNPNGSYSKVEPPSNGIGIPHGIWFSHQYDTEGLDQYSPIFMLPNASAPGYFLIHVRSRDVRNYTLADFFNVWGQPISPNNTIGIRPQTSTGLIWTMCVGFPPNQHFGRWGNQTLVKDIFVVLLYSTLDCGGP